MNYDISHSVEVAVAMLKAWAVHPSAEYLATVYGFGFWALFTVLGCFYLLHLGRQGKRENRQYGSSEYSGATVSSFDQTEAD